ncbi:nitroreductase/quinone reductase family protein [Streptomyces sp. RS10V-4]|uniref:nitroreductase/quinone reductase family protein n=1 Tax=Streptomyces rhizoryzae TaxID=2932493 RepID=UPI002005401B|nr:nitroreductase/quinone reductase family protein [Streptomyces rhizoryzae]MCK7626092.1 nitroreductase/quinone reductase family protein [Streptomyces rhizoryzae]
MDQDASAQANAAGRAGARSATAQAMIEHLRARTPEPYRDRRPVVRVINVVGRRSGRPRPFGVNVTAIDGRLYLCSSTRSRDWIRNLLAAGRCRVERDAADGSDTERRPVMVEGHEAARALAVYLPQAGYRDPQLPFEPDAPVEEIERHVHRTAVVRLDPVDA